MKITILGNSVPLRVRPPQQAPNNKNYTYLLREKLKSKFDNIEVENKAVGAQTTINLNADVDRLINSFPDYYVLNIGVVDSCSRDIPLWLYRMVTKKSNAIFYRFLQSIYYSNFMSKNRNYFVQMRFHKPWVSKKRFKTEFRALVQTLKKETNARIILIPINLANDRIEQMLPGSRSRQIEYNQIISEVADEFSADYLDISDLRSTEHYPDGVHYNSNGHQVIANRIFETIVSSYG